ncbi:DUF1653 domain-containing protein [Candidatus Saccharibacteria bacterium]|nr:DUF1653 domain-containing protein [Candidatus Saccharibacteria bacterium]MBR3236648.1 DUF1653 domain-containing protein [Candidatus Saccharibacteria bacterium]
MKRGIVIHGVYRHFKGNSYIVEDLAIDSETGENVVLYRALYGDGLLYARPLKMFLSPVDKTKYPNAQQKWRFELSSDGQSKL